MCRDTACYGADVKMISMMLSDTALNALLMTSGPDQTLSQHTLSLVTTHSFFPKNMKDPAAPHTQNQQHIFTC